MNLLIKTILLMWMGTAISCKGTPAPPTTSDNIATEVSAFDTLPLYNRHYDFSTPDQLIKLPVVLKEVSGITLSSDENSFLCIQDESGVIYQIDLHGKIQQKYPFWKAGDYEDLVRVKDTIYVVKSTGTIYKVIDLGKKHQHVEKYNTFLEKINDVEGLAYDPLNNSLLLSCKGFPFHKNEEKDFNTKTTYEFPLIQKELNFSPKITISLGAIQIFLSNHKQLKNWEKFDKYFGQKAEKLKLAPSALAFHPISGDLYLLSSSKKVLIIMDRNNNILHIERLNKKKHTQPEGIAFSKNGDLFIADEGQESNATIHKYIYKK